MPNSPLDLSDNDVRRFCEPLLKDSKEEASRLRHNYIGTEHIFNGLTRIPGGITSRMLRESGLDPREVRNRIRREVGMGDDVISENPPFTPRAFRVLSQAVYLADDMGEQQVVEEQLLLSLLQEGRGVPIRVLLEFDVDIEYWIEYLTRRLNLDDDASDDEGVRFRDDVYYQDMDMHAPFHMDSDDDYDSFPSMPTPLLNKYGRDLTEQAKLGKIHEAIGRDTEIRAVARTLSRSKKNNPLLVGDAGVGKTAVVEGLAWQIAQGKAPATLKDKRIVQIEIGTLVAGTSLRGQFEERLVGIVEEARTANNVILFIDEIHTIVGAGDTIDSNLDAANILKPALARGEISCVGATTYEEYRKAVAKDPALDRRFRTIEIREPSEAESLMILEQMYKRYENHHHVTILPEAREAAVKLSARYLPDRRLPDKALDLLDEACARIVIQTHTPDEESAPSMEVNAHTVREVISEWTGIPVAELTASERARIASMEDRINQRVIGQAEGVKTVVATIKTQRAGLGNFRRPTGVFLFVGPSGVGKTELARALAEFMFGDDDAMIRLDMSEFYDEHTAARLIGAPPGYKGAEKGGQLTEALRRKPYSVVLLDEVEKAAPQVFDLFLQVFDEGRLSDSNGATVDARHAVWIMTSNIGSEDVGKGLGFMGQDNDLPNYKEHMKKFFRPEFLNRLDEVVVFKPLDRAALDRILDQQLDEVIEKLDAQNLSLILTQEARALILQDGYSPAEGARPLRRAIERLLTRPLSSEIMEDKFGPGDVVRVLVNEDKLTFERGN